MSGIGRGVEPAVDIDLIDLASLDEHGDSA